MAKYNYDLLNLDVIKLFEDRTIAEIIEVQNVLDAEIEKKRNELRSMVGDRYKDVLTASDAIKSMKSISRNIVDSIERITNRCQELTESSPTINIKGPPQVDAQKIEERTIVIQIRLAFIVKDHIWLALDEEDFSKAAQFYLLAQHIHTGLRLLRKEVLEKLPLLKRIKTDVDALKGRILKRVKEKLQTVELYTEGTSSYINALMLLENQSSLNWLKTYIELRKSALLTVIHQAHPSVRAQVTAMVRCLITTVHLLHNCFISYNNTKTGLIWQQLEKIINENSPLTLSKINLPPTPLCQYIPQIIKQFRPKCINSDRVSLDDIEDVLKDWLNDTSQIVMYGLEKSLQLVVNIKGLHIIREEALKIEIPLNWEIICMESKLPTSFNIWNYYFQALITKRAENLITKLVSSNLIQLQNEISLTLSNIAEAGKNENDLRWYVWKEDTEDVSQTENKHLGLSMKTKGFSPNVVKLCEKLNAKYLELLQDLCSYLYGKIDEEEDINFSFLLKDLKCDKKFGDRQHLENHIRIECSKSSYSLTKYLEELDFDKELFVTKSLLCARFLESLKTLCPNFRKCCTCSNNTEEWDKICNYFDQSSFKFWLNWVKTCNSKTTDWTKELNKIATCDMIKILPRWDEIEIQEQAEEKIFKSQIKVPLQPNLTLQEVFTSLSYELNLILPHTVPKQIHLQFIESNVLIILNQYSDLVCNELNQTQALQFLFDVKFTTSFCIPRENVQLISKSQDICDKLRSKIDPFDLDVFYSYIQNNVKRCVLQSQVIMGCLLPNSGQLSNIGMYEKNKENEKEPSVLAVSIPSTSSWFPLLPITAPIQKSVTLTSSESQKDLKSLTSKQNKPTHKKSPSDATSSVRSGAAALFGAMANEWFS